MAKRFNLTKFIFLSMLVAIGVVISPILRVEGLCPTAHLVNIVAAVFLGPTYAFVCAFTIGIIRMFIMGIPPLALTGAVFGALLSGILYKASKGKIIWAVLGEIIGTGIIGALISYPVMALFLGYTHLTWFFYVPSFLLATLMGGGVAFIFLGQLKRTGMLSKIQNRMGSLNYETV